MSVKTTTRQCVLGYLLHWGSITRHRALTHCDCWQLPLAIFNLRRKGYMFTRSGAGADLKYTLIKSESESKSESHG